MSEEIGLAAGEIWRYLNQTGKCKVSTLTKSLSIKEKVLQRALGWLDKEDKIIFSTEGRAETVSLK